MQGAISRQENSINREFLSKYISFARKNINPVITDLAGQHIVQAYKKMRGIGSAFKTITATPRQLESLIRLSEAHAKLRLSPYVELSDVEEAERLIRVATHTAATDPMTGKIDMDIITSGMSAQVRETVKQLGNLIKSLLRENAEAARKGIVSDGLYEQVKLRAEKNGQQVSEIDYRAALKDLEEQQIVGLYKHQKNPTIRYIEVTI